MTTLALPTHPAPATQPPDPAARSAWIRGGALAAAYFGCAMISRQLTENPEGEASYWLPSGLVLGALLTLPRREWVIVVGAMGVGDFFFNLLGASWPWDVWGIVTVGNAAAALVGAWLIQRWVAPCPDLTSVRQLVGLVGLGGGVSLMLNATIGAWLVQSRLSGLGTSYAEIWSSWYFSDLLGVILIAPLMLVWRGRVSGVWQWPRARRVEAVAAVAGVVLCLMGAIVYGWTDGPGLRYLMLPFVIWAAIRFGPRGVTTMSLAVALLMGWFALSGYGEEMPSVAPPHARNAQLQLALSFVGFFGLIPAIVIEAHRRTEAELREQRNFLRAIFESELECVKIIGPTDVLVQVNRAGLAMLEVTDVAEARDYGAVNFVLPEFRDRYVDLNRRAQAGENGTLIYQLRGKKGTVRWLETHATPLRDVDGHSSGILTVTRDITEKRAAEDVRRKGEEQLRLIFSAVADGIVVHDDALRILQSNATAGRILGFRPDDRPGSPPLDPRWQAVREDGQPYSADEHPAAVALRTGVPVRDAIMGICGPDRPISWISVNAEPLRDPAGRVTMVVSSFSGITARRALLEQVRQAQKMEVVGQLAGGVAHDFNNILTAMMLNLQLIQIDHRLPADSLHLWEDLQTMTRRAASLTEQLLLFARRRAMKMERIELNAGIHNVLKLLHRVLGEPIAITLRLAPEALWIEADPGMIDQVVMNLCVNARDAMPQGGTLTIETAGVEFGATGVALAAHLQARPGRFACLRVKDSGCGMPPEVLAHLFEPFFTTKEIGKGTGLGLATVHGITHRHQGWLEVTSVVGQGSEFLVYLPVAEAAAGAPAAAPAPAVLPDGTETLLLVEDEAAVRLTTAQLLRRNGYRVLEAANGPDALAVWRQHRGEIDLLVTDMVMPEGINGLALGETLRRERPKLGVVIMSGYSEEILKAESLQALGVALIAKPFEIGTLLSAVRRSLAGLPAQDKPA